MATRTLTQTDVRTRDAVVRQLDWDPLVDSSAIGVAARDGVVTLTGFIDSYSGKLGAERAAKRVCGVRAVANDIGVRVKLERTDADLARDVSRALGMRPGVPDTVQASVHGGYVTLTGKVGWIAQKKHAEKALRHVAGVRGVFNHIDLPPGPAHRDVQHRIRDVPRFESGAEGIS